MRWLLAKYYTHKFCDQGYICRVLQHMESYTDTALAQNMARSIFSLEDPSQYIEQRQLGLSIAAENGVEIPIERVSWEKYTTEINPEIGAWWHFYAHMLPDITKAKEKLGYKPKYTPEEALRTAVQWMIDEGMI